jgi:hypothetical protein
LVATAFKKGVKRSGPESGLFRRRAHVGRRCADRCNDGFQRRAIESFAWHDTPNMSVNILRFDFCFIAFAPNARYVDDLAGDRMSRARMSTRIFDTVSRISPA